MINSRRFLERCRFGIAQHHSYPVLKMGCNSSQPTVAVTPAAPEAPPILPSDATSAVADSATAPAPAVPASAIHAVPPVTTAPAVSDSTTAPVPASAIHAASPVAAVAELNSAFVFIKPHANTARVQELVAQTLRAKVRNATHELQNSSRHLYSSTRPQAKLLVYMLATHAVPRRASGSLLKAN